MSNPVLPPIPFEAVRRWTFSEALPLWLDRSVDATHGGFIETLTLQGEDAGSPFKRTRVAFRQVYVFSHAALLGWDEGLAAAQRGAEDIVRCAWRSDGKGFVRRLTREGGVLDPVIDLYDNSFALFGLAWLHRATDSDWSREWLDRTFHAIQGLRHPSGLGFNHEENGEPPRLQNPHMHLTEACLAAFEATGESRFFEQAREIVGLFQERFHDGRTLGEYFDARFRRLPDDRGHIVEPGHQMEWAWILATYARASGETLNESVAALVDESERSGVDPISGVTYNAVDDRGGVIDGGSRTWPNTERLKAAIAAREVLGRDTRQAASAATRLLLNRYLASPLRGGWIDAFDSEGRPLVEVMPTSTLYHVFLAFAELLRTQTLFEEPPAPV